MIKLKPVSAQQALSRRLDDAGAIGKQAGSLKSAFAQLDQVAKGVRAQASQSKQPTGSSSQARADDSQEQETENADGKKASASGSSHY